MRFFILRADGAYVSFEGMTIEQITASLAGMGMTGVEISEAEYTAATQASGMF